MPPRFAYWTILIDGKPTAFRARDPQELLPTLNQLKRTNTDVLMRWFARGHLWESPEAERAAARTPRPREKRGRDWRPGGEHKDPRARFDGQKEKLAARPRRQGEGPTDRPRRPFAPRRESPFGKRPATGKRPPFQKRPPVGGRPHGGRPPVPRPFSRPPRPDRPLSERPQGRRPSPPPRRDETPRKPRGDPGGASPPSNPPAGKPAPPKRR